jgi:hypothetical protein
MRNLDIKIFLLERRSNPYQYERLFFYFLTSFQRESKNKIKI